MNEIWECVRDGALEQWTCLKSEAKDCWEELDEMDLTFTKREVLLGAAACTAVGIIIGMLCSPKKQTVIQTAAPAEDPEKEEK